MARKKNVEKAPVIPQDLIEREQPIETAAPIDAEEQPIETAAPIDAEEQVPPVKEVKQEVEEPSEQLKKLLRCYSNYAALYVDSKGGVYPEGTQPNLVGDAILYQNPYYKS